MLQVATRWWVYNQIAFICFRFWSSIFIRKKIFSEYLYFVIWSLIFLLIHIKWFKLKYYVPVALIASLIVHQYGIIYQFIDALQVRLNEVLMWGCTPLVVVGHYRYWGSLFPTKMVEFYKHFSIFVLLETWYYVAIAFISAITIQCSLIYMWKMIYSPPLILCVGGFTLNKKKLVSCIWVILTIASMEEYFFVTSEGMIRFIGIVATSFSYFIVSSNAIYFVLKKIKYLK